MRGLAELGSPSWHPLLGEEHPERRSGGTHWHHRSRRPFERRGDRLGIDLASAGGMPTSAFASGECVDAVVGDDVEALFAFDDVGHANVIGS